MGYKAGTAPNWALTPKSIWDLPGSQGATAGLHAQHPAGFLLAVPASCPEGTGCHKQLGPGPVHTVFLGKKTTPSKTTPSALARSALEEGELTPDL